MSIRKISILGLVLMIASAITAAIMPAKSEFRFANDGTLKNGNPDSTDGNSCLARTGAASYTFNSITTPTVPPEGSSFDDWFMDTRNNTSNDAANPAYNTSIVE